MTTASTPIASNVLTVSYNVSPFCTLEVCALKSIVFNPNFCSAIKKEYCVRVLGSKKRLATTPPLNEQVVSPFAKRFATCKISNISSIVRSDNRVKCLISFTFITCFYKFIYIFYEIWYKKISIKADLLYCPK